MVLRGDGTQSLAFELFVHVRVGSTTPTKSHDATRVAGGLVRGIR